MDRRPPKKWGDQKEQGIAGRVAGCRERTRRGVYSDGYQKMGGRRERQPYRTRAPPGHETRPEIRRALGLSPRNKAR